jgi:hypothetical protein
MVWSQYVYEANVGFDTYASDDDEYNDDIPLNIDEWEVKYSDELWMMWNTMRTILSDMYLENTLLTECRFTDFVEFCYIEHDDSHLEHHEIKYEEEVRDIWKSIRRVVNLNDLHEEMMRGATYNNFIHFVSNYTRKKYISVY